MSGILRLQGRPLSGADVAGIRQLIAANPAWSRRRISEQLAGQWNWRNGVGQLKDMAARNLLLKLDQRGLVQLPPRRFAPNNRMRSQRVEVRAWDQSPIHCSLDSLSPLQVREVNLDGEERALFIGALRAFHYLGHGGTVGENLGYVVRDAQARPLAFLLFGAAAWKCQDRDRFIGWTPEQRERNLGLLTNNTRFLIFPRVKVARLASWALVIPRQQIVQWIEHMAGLLRLIVDRMWQRMEARDPDARDEEHRDRSTPARKLETNPPSDNVSGAGPNAGSGSTTLGKHASLPQLSRERKDAVRLPLTLQAAHFPLIKTLEQFNSGRIRE